MLKIVDIAGISPNTTPKFIKTQLVTASRDGKLFPWEMIVSHDSVHVLVNSVDTGELLFVTQVRVPVLVNNPGTSGIILETCAGLVDKDIPLEEIAREEILEEMGYNTTNDIQFIKTLKSSVGTAGTNAHCFYVDVYDDEKVSEGGGLDGEDIEVHLVPLDELIAMTKRGDFPHALQVAALFQVLAYLDRVQ